MIQVSCQILLVFDAINRISGPFGEADMQDGVPHMLQALQVASSSIEKWPPINPLVSLSERYLVLHMPY